MEKKQKGMAALTRALVVVGLVVLSMFAVAGNLEPGAPPGPTMKTLGEVEPRIAVQSLAGDANSLYVISQPGSYYLTGNITGEPNKCGIEITTNNVTVDLMGFVVIGVPGSLDGFRVQYQEASEPLPIEEVSFNFSIRNGTICNWGGNGIDAYDVFLKIEGDLVKGKILVHSNSELLNVSVHANAERGFYGRNCHAHMEDVSFCNNGGNGIDAYDGFLKIEGGNVSDNDANGIDAYDMFLQIDGLTSLNNADHGLVVDGNSCGHMEDVSFAYNGDDGMHILGMMTNVDAYSGYASHNGGNGMYVKAQGRARIHLKDMSFVDNDANGLSIVGESHNLLEDVTFTHNGGHGMVVLGMMTNVDAYSTTTGHNGGSGIVINGRGNLDKCSAVGNGGVGVQVGQGSTMTGGRANDNESHGIQVSANCRVVGNTCEGNGKGAIGIQEPAGIYASGNGNRIEGNHVVGNKVGIDVDGTDNVIIKNSAMGNSTNNYDLAAGNGVGPIIGTGDVDSSDNPHANYDF